ncbi:MAG TPA: MFS transporter [Puia sp.]|nr:MFS transporter [Puia sp.]
MMFLQFFIWGAWYATGGNYMKSHGMANVIYLAYMTSAIGAIISPFFLGMIADRFFPVQKVLGIMHILSGIFVFSAPFFAEGSLISTPLFLGFLLLHMLCYMPTVNLAAATAFHILDNREKQFPLIRLFGTLGWITAGILVSKILKGDTTAMPMRISGIGGVLMGFYSFTLPNITPSGSVKKISFRDVIGADAFAKLKSRSFIIFIISLLLISLPFAAYFSYVPVFLQSAGIANPAFKMTFGQMSEIIFLLVLPLFFARFGIKWVLLTGMLAWATRYALFALAAPGAIGWMITAGILLHGCCYDFVYVAGQIYIDKKATPDIRAQAQGLFVIVSYGVGQGLGTLAAGGIFNSIMADGITLNNWQRFWIIPLLFSAVVSILFIFGFREKLTGLPK